MGIVDEKCKCTEGIVVGKEVQQVVFENFLHLTMDIKTYGIIYNIKDCNSSQFRLVLLNSIVVKKE